MDLTILAVIVLVGAIAFFGAWYVLQRKVQAGAALVLAAFVAHATVISYSPLAYQRINFYPEDLVFALLATVAIPRAFSLRGRPWTQLACSGFCVLVLGGFILGALANNLKLSGVECRPYFYFSTCALYFATFTYTRSNITKLAWLWSAATLSLIAVACYRWMAQFLDLPAMVSWVNTSQATTLRVLAANEALFLWQAFLFNLYLRVSSPAAKIRFYVCLALPPVLILLQHRSVWVAMLASSAIVLVREKIVSRRVAFVGLAAIVAVGLILLIPPGDVSDSIRSSLDHSLREPLDTSESTFSWRVEGWRQLLGGGYLENASEVVFGRHFGRGLLRYYHGQPINFSAHNAYVDTLMQLGIAGVCLLLCCYIGSLARLRRLRPNGLVFTQAIGLFRVMLAANLVYFMAYGVSYEQGVILGMAIGMTGSANRKALLLGIHYAVVPIKALHSRVGARLSPSIQSGGPGW